METHNSEITSFSEASVLSNEEYRILQLFEEGSSSEEIGEKLGLTKWTINYRYRQILAKVEAYRQTYSIRDAMASGEVPSINMHDKMFNRKRHTRVGIVGCGNGALSLFDVFDDDEVLDICWIVERNPSAVGMKRAWEFELPVFETLGEVTEDKVDIVINLTHDLSVSKDIKKILGSEVEVIGGESARLIWLLLDSKKKQLARKEMVLREREIFYHLGLLIENVNDLEDAGYAIADYATRLTSKEIAAVVIFDDEGVEASLLASKGFDDDTATKRPWPIEKCALSSLLLKETIDEPILFKDLKLSSAPLSSLAKKGVDSLLAMPFVVEKKVTGYILVAGREKQSFSTEDISLFKILSIFSAVSIDNIAAIEKMRLLSMTDGLTGLFNQRSFMERLEQEIERCKRYGHHLSLVMLDIDCFKSYNDEFGHMEGNKLLKEFSNLMEDIARKTDVVARFGGEEFCLLLLEVEKDGAVILANRLREAVASHEMPNRKITVSGGVASFPSCAENHIDLLRKADISLYKAKDGGRNKICT